MCTCEQEGGAGVGGMMIKDDAKVFGLSTSKDGIHYLGKAEGKASLDQSRNSVFHVIFEIT